MPLSNASRLADFGTGIGTAGAIIQVDNANQRLGVGTTAPTATLGVAGIVSATAFYGDGSNLDGVASAGLGTALSEVEFDPLTVIYQTSDTLSVGATITVDPPDATTKVAYTQYAEILLQDDADLIVADGDDFIPDILGLSTEGFSFSNANGNGIFDTVYTDNIENAAGRGAPNFPLGITVSGISTLSGNVSIGGTLTYEDVTNVDSIGIVTARNGIDITGGDLNAASNLILKTGGTERVRIQSNGSAQFTPEGSTSNPNLLIETSGDNIRLNSKKDTGNGGLIFVTQNAGTSSERLRIGSAGQLGLSGANYGTSGQVMTSQGGSAAPQWADAAGGMSEYDVWSQTNNSAVSEWDYQVIGNHSVTITNARQTTTQNPLFTKIGTGMSYASGIWTFPSTGHWECIFRPLVQANGGESNQQFHMEVTLNNGTAWNLVSNPELTGGGNYGWTIQPVYNLLNITDVSQQKVRYKWKSNIGSVLKGSTSSLRTHYIWKKVA